MSRDPGQTDQLRHVGCTADSIRKRSVSYASLGRHLIPRNEYFPGPR